MGSRPDKETIRSFFAIELPAELKANITIYSNSLKELAPKVKWVKSSSLHITLKFLGEQSSQLVEQVVTSLIDLPHNIRPFNVKVSEFGSFPNPKNPRGFWLGVENGQLLNRFNQIEDRLLPLGFEKEKRRFSAHLTLGRVKFPQDFNDLWDFVENKLFTPFNFEVKQFVLMRSILKPSSAEYRVIQKYPLQG